MNLTSLLLVETLSHSDYIMVNVANTSCTDDVVPANSSQRQLIESCIDTQFHVTLVDINLSAIWQKFNRWIVVSLMYVFLLFKCMYVSI